MRQIRRNEVTENIEIGKTYRFFEEEKGKHTEYFATIKENNGKFLLMEVIADPKTVKDHFGEPRPYMYTCDLFNIGKTAHFLKLEEEY